MLAKVKRSDVSTKDNSALQLLSNVQASVNWTGSKQFFERQWMINHAHYLGHQDIRWNRYANRPVGKRFPSHRTTATFNKIRPAVEVAQSLMTQQRPKWTCKPQTSSFEDTQASRVGASLLDHYWDELELELKVSELVLWATICGTAFLYNTTKSDPRTKQRVYIDPISKQPMPGSAIHDSMRRMMEEAGLYLDYLAHEPDLRVLSPFRIAQEPRAASLDDARYIFHVTEMSIDEVYERWGTVVSAEEHPLGMANYENRLKSFWGSQEGAGAVNEMDGDGRSTSVQEVILKPYVEQNSRTGKWDEYPNGRHVVVAGGSVMIDDENPYYKAGFRSGFPFTKFDWISVPGRFWGMALVEELIDPQKAYNDIRRREIDLFRLMGQPKWTAPMGANLKRDAINDKPGEIIEWNASSGPAPTPVLPTPFAPGVVQTLQASAYRDIQDSAGQHDTMSGNAPAQMRSGPAIQLAREGDMHNLSPKAQRLEKCVGDAAENLLRTAAEVLDENSYIEIVGSHRDLDLVHFKGASLKGVKSVRVIRGSMMPQSAALQFQKALDLVQTGGLNPGGSSADREILVRAAAFHEHDVELNTLVQERKRAERENESMFAPLDSGMFHIAQVMPFDDDMIHLQAHYERVRSPEFEKLSPEQREAILGHNYQHEERIRQMEQQRMMMTMMMKGAPGEKGTPSPPKPDKKGG